MHTMAGASYINDPTPRTILHIVSYSTGDVVQSSEGYIYLKCHQNYFGLHTVLPVGYQAPVFHGITGKIRNGYQIHLVERVGCTKVLRVKW